MTQQHIPIAPAAAPGSLRPTEHPDLSRVLVHFCGRPRQPGVDVPAYIASMTPQSRLENILWEQGLQMFVTFSGGDPAACLSEVTEAGLRYMIQTRGYAPWGLMFERESVFNAGGGPVWHVRTEQHEQLKQLAPLLRSWAVRLGDGSDWLEEREWRIVRPKMPGGFAPTVGLSELRLLGLLVGDTAWQGARYETHVPSGGSKPQPGWYFPPVHPGLPRVLWNAASGQLQTVSPLF
jgi:hypothetical protein